MLRGVKFARKMQMQMPSLTNSSVLSGGNWKIRQVAEKQFAERQFATCIPLKAKHPKIFGKSEKFMSPKLPEDPDDKMKIVLLLSGVVAIASLKTR